MSERMDAELETECPWDFGPRLVCPNLPSTTAVGDQRNEEYEAGTV